MKKLFLICSLLFSALAFFAQDENHVLGTWLTSNGDSKVTIKKGLNGKFSGEIVWLKEPNRDGKPKTDHKNPDEKLRSRPTLGLTILSGFKYDVGDKEWQDGTIYDPKEGKTYKCIMWFDSDPKQLHVKGYIGFSLIGKEVLWVKVN
ncbi:MAG: DUF2147 domain-containing protein [bacterium]|nr:DUF2147 domain-containing protein [bacterium]